MASVSIVYSMKVQCTRSDRDKPPEMGHKVTSGKVAGLYENGQDQQSRRDGTVGNTVWTKSAEVPTALVCSCLPDPSPMHDSYQLVYIM